MWVSGCWLWQVADASKALVTKEHQATGNISADVWLLYPELMWEHQGLALVVVFSCILLNRLGMVAGDFWLQHWTAETGGSEEQPMAHYIGIYAFLLLTASFMTLVGGLSLVHGHIGVVSNPNNSIAGV